MTTVEVQQSEIGDLETVLASLEQSQWKPAEDIQAKQLQRIGFILAHAYQTVPFYRESLADTGYALGQPISVDFLRTLPVLQRSQINQSQEKMLSTAITDSTFLYGTRTSGSTGVPINIKSGYESHLYWRAIGLRDHYWHERDFSQVLASIRYSPRGVAPPPLGEIFPSWGELTDGLHQTGVCVYLNVVSDTKAQVEWLCRHNPTYLVTFPSQLKVLALYCIAHQISPPKLRQARTVGETVTPELRQLVAYAWDAKVVDVYSSDECGYLALQCPLHPHYHVQSENVWLEVVNENNQPCLPGESGRVLVTTLHNLVMPLIRYELGDYATLGHPCNCGRDALPVLEKIDGRTRNRVHYPNGDSCFPYLGEHKDYGAIYHGSKGYQFTQLDRQTIEYKIAIDGELTEQQKRDLTALIQKNFKYPFDIIITVVPEFVKQAGGKFEEFISLVADGS